MKTPLDGAATTYTNEMQAQNLREQVVEMGIERVGKPSQAGAETEEVRASIGYAEGVERTRTYARQFQAQRGAIDRNRNKPVSLDDATTPRMLPGKPGGGPVEAK